MCQYFKKSQILFSYLFTSLILHLCIVFSRDKTTVEDASTLFPQDLFTYAQEHRLLEHVIVTPDKMPNYNDTGVASLEEVAVTLGETHGPTMAVEEGPAPDLSKES